MKHCAASTLQTIVDRHILFFSDASRALAGPVRILFALGLLAIALGIRLLLDPWLGERLSYPSVLTATLLAAWFFATGPAIVIAAIGYLAIELLFHETPFANGALDYLIPSVALYAMLVWVVVFFSSTLRAAYEQLEVARHALSNSEKRHRAWFDQAPLGVLELDRDDRIRGANAEACRLLRYPRDELVGRSVHDVAASEKRRRHVRLLQRLHRGELQRLDCESEYVRGDGSRIWVEATLSAIREQRPEDDRYVGIIADIGRRKAAEKELKESREQFEQLANHIPQAFWITDLEKRTVIFVSPAFERIHGVSLGSRRPARAWKGLLHPDDRPDVMRAHRKLGSGAADLQYRIVRPDGAVRWVHARGYPIKNADGVVYRVAGTIEDITERRALENRLLHQAHYDGLTALPNRVVFFDRLRQALNYARRERQAVGLLCIDLDDFKIVNDTMGHEIGDKLLVQVGRALCAVVRSEDTVARIGGDVFAIILPRIGKPEHASLIADKVLDVLSRLSHIEGSTVSVSASIGVAISSSDGTGAETLLKNADHAMLRAKQTGKNGYAFYTDAMNQSVAERRMLQRLLSTALQENEFSLHFQAKANIRSGELTGCEALLRWTASRNGSDPGKFVPILEESGLIVPVGEWVVRTACRQIADWKREGVKPLPIAINVSARQFNQRNFTAVIQEALRDNGVDSDLLELELTESTAMQNAQETIQCLHMLKDIGVKIAIDDFGTGHSSLSYLTRLPIDVLKIDRSFVTGIPEKSNDASIAKAIINMAHSLFLKVIAEGVEHEHQLDFLARNSCDEVQGYLLSRPLPSSEMTRLMKRQISPTWHGTVHSTA